MIIWAHVVKPAGETVTRVMLDSPIDDKFFPVDGLLCQDGFPGRMVRQPSGQEPTCRFCLEAARSLGVTALIDVGEPYKHAPAKMIVKDLRGPGTGVWFPPNTEAPKERTEIVAITGIRALAPESEPAVEMAITEALGTAKEIRFGGALGSDTVSLVAAAAGRRGASQPRLVVVVPFNRAAQPADARPSFDVADEVRELRLPRSKAAYLRRNDAMLQGATRLIAFSDGRHEGGTYYTITKARKLGIPVQIVEVASDPKPNPVDRAQFAAPIYAWKPYVSAKDGYDKWSQTVRDMKGGEATNDEVDDLAMEMGAFMEHVPDLRDADGIAVMPRRRPGRESDMTVLGMRLARLLHVRFLDGWLERTEEPQGGRLMARRLRFDPAEHARTIAAGRATSAWHNVEWAPRKVIVLDNVVTTGGSMEGAFRAIRRDTGAEPVGVAILAGEGFAPKAASEPPRRRAGRASGSSRASSGI